MIERLSTTRTNERGTILVLFTLALTVLLLVASLVVDLGIAHVTSADLDATFTRLADRILTRLTL